MFQCFTVLLFHYSNVLQLHPLLITINYHQLQPITTNYNKLQPYYSNFKTARVISRFPEGPGILSIANPDAFNALFTFPLAE